MLNQSVTQSLSLCYYSKFSDVNVTGGGVWYPGEQVTVEGNLIFDQFGLWNQVGGVTVKLTFAGHTYTTTTSTLITSQYGFVFNIIVPQLADGQYDAVLSFDGSGSVWLLDCISPCSYSFAVTIQAQGPSGISPPQEQYPSQLSLTVSPEITVGQSATLIATVTYADGTPAPEFKVDFAVNGVQIGSATTNAEGIADVSFTPEAEGSYTATAWLDADQSVTASASFTASPQTLSGTTCTSNSQCPQGYVCQNGTCVMQQVTGCTSNSQCPQGYVCQNGTCTQCNGIVIGSTCVSTWAIIAGVGAVAIAGIAIVASK